MATLQNEVRGIGAVFTPVADIIRCRRKRSTAAAGT
jgi:hypothetical protein